MTANLGLLLVVGILISSGVYLLLERSLTKMLLGVLLMGNAINLLILTIGGAPENPPIVGHTAQGRTGISDPLAQGMILTAIVITMGIAAFVLALAYRSFIINTADRIDDDAEDTRVFQRSSDPAPEDDDNNSEDSDDFEDWDSEESL
ncbi:MAG: Na(+)/H(+) antiporter subunit C [Mycobacteriaceae bacterium]